MWGEDDAYETMRAMDKINTRADILQREEQSPINKKIYEDQEEINRNNRRSRIEQQVQNVEAFRQDVIDRTIRLNIQTTVTPDGVTTRAEATQDGRDVSGQQIATN
jgi:hypothetical protein